MVEAIFEYGFLRNAIIAGVMASVISGIIGVMILQKKLFMMIGGIAHTAYGGVGLGYLLGFEPILGAGIFAVVSAFVIGAVRKKGGIQTDIVIALLWSSGMASGVAFTSLIKGYPPDMNSYLFGNILSVTSKEIYLMFVLMVAVVLAIIIFYNDWLAFLVDCRFSKVAGIRTSFLENLLLVLIALSIVVLIRIVGIILVIALLSVPAATATFIAKTLKGQMLLSGVLSAFFCISGLALSYYSGIASGAAIVFVAVMVYFPALIFLNFKVKNSVQ